MHRTVRPVATYVPRSVVGLQHEPESACPFGFLFSFVPGDDGTDFDGLSVFLPVNRNVKALKETQKHSLQLMAWLRPFSTSGFLTERAFVP